MSNAWGQLTWSIGNFGAQNDATVDVTGVSLSATLNSLADVTTTVDFGWGRQEWNAQAWGIAGTLIPNSVSATITLNDIAEINGDALVIPDSLQITATTGDATGVGLAEVILDSLSATVATGQLDIEPDANPVGIEMSADLGTVAAYNLEGWGRYFWGEFVWGATGLWATGDLTGVQLTATIDNIGEVNGDASTGDLDSLEATIAEGNLDADPDANISGIELTIATGDLTDILADANVTPDSIALSVALGDEEAIPNTIASPIGLSLTMSLDSVDITGNANVSVTGFALTTSLTSVFPLIWNEVQTNSDATWTEVDTAA